MKIRGSIDSRPGFETRSQTWAESCPVRTPKLPALVKVDALPAPRLVRRRQRVARAGEGRQRPRGIDRPVVIQLVG